MNTPKKLLRSDIQIGCTAGTYERGRDYYAKGRVLNLTIVNKGVLFVQLSATVKGNDVIPYKQNIRITWRADYSSATIMGNCSCAVGYNCKHVVAACLMYQYSQQSSTIDASCLEWLSSLDEPTPQRDSHADFIAYILKPSDKAHEFTVEILVTKEKKSGGLNKGRKLSLHNITYLHQVPNYFQHLDSDVIKLLCALNSNYMWGEPVLSGVIGFLALEKLLQTNRLFWQDGTRPALKAGENRDLQFNWQQSDNGDYQLSIAIEAEALLMLTDPPQYLDTHAGTIGAFNTAKLTTEQLKKYLSAPPIPAKYADEFSMRLTVEHAAHPLPAPKKIPLTELGDLTPTPKLRLFGKQLTNSHTQHLMAVSFQYGQWELSAKKPEAYSVIKTKQGLLRIQRQLDAENSAITRLTEWGFNPLSFDVPDEPALLLTSKVNTVLEEAAQWANFLHNALPELQEDGWIIDSDDSFKLGFQTAQSWDAEIGTAQNDWFEMRFNVDINGQPYPLLPLIMPVLENYTLDNLPEILNLPLGNYQYLSVPSDTLKPILAVLLELFNASLLGKDGTLKLSRFNVASLADLETHSYGLFSLTGGQELREMARKLTNFAGIEAVALPTNFQAELRPYQQQGLNWLQFLREYKFAGILADDMGLGKTIQTLVHLLVEKQAGRMTSPCLIIAPTSLMSNWRREAERFTPDLSVLILQGAERKQHFDKINDYDLVLTTYPLLPRDEEILLKHHYHYLILDEAQTVKNPTALAAQLVRKINTNHRLCLTGTPMENHLGELWAQFDFLMPHFLGDSGHFKKQYRTPIETLGDTERKAQLSRRLAPFLLRRTKQAVASELPAKTEIIRSVPLHPKQAVLYESIRLTMEKKVRDAIAERGLSRSHITILDALLKLRQTCCDPRTLSLKEAQKIKESAKLDLLMDLLPEQLEEGRRILVFSQFTRMIALIEEELNTLNIGYSKLTGQTKKRDEAIELFKSGEVNVFLISLKAGGVGLNLTEADTVIIYDPWWNPAVESQAADRAHRIGQDKPVFVYKLVTENTVEEKILAMQERKRALADSIYGDEAKEQDFKLTADELTALFQPL
ncbi:MAG: SNF2-related protein [Methylococcaceae bacterium NSP1-2]|nr:DEAD/DEAH box helicase [Methylococcaceae bacterium]OYV19748.1 MAG: SNF2-related protein [Methylococcaceae bacterium NSP1-2]